MTDGFTEPGRSVEPDGRVIYAWPPQGRFADLWARMEAAFPDERERCEAACLLARWRDETSTLVGYTDEAGDWHDTEPDWAEVAAWLSWNPPGSLP